MKQFIPLVTLLFFSGGPRYARGIKGSTRIWRPDNPALNLPRPALENAASVPASSRINVGKASTLGVNGKAHHGGSPVVELQVGDVLSNAALVAGNTIDPQPVPPTFVPPGVCTAQMIGAGVLALPEVARAPGFFPSSAAMVLVWGYCLATGLLIAECSGDGRESIQKMAEASLGRTAGNAMCATFLAANYLLMVAYISQGGSLLSSLPFITSNTCPPVIGHLFSGPHVAPLTFTALAGCSNIWGPAPWVEKTNTALVGVIALSFVGLVRAGISHVDLSSLGCIPDASALPTIFPVALCALAFQNVVPVVSKNLEGDSKRIRSSLVIGSGIPLFTYMLWNAVVLGNTSGLTSSVATSAMDDIEAMAPSSYINVLMDNSPSLGLLVALFSMSAIITSFWGAASSLIMEWTHLAEKAVVSSSGRQFMTEDSPVAPRNSASKDMVVKTAASALVLLPPAMVSMACPDAFLSALQYTGVFLDPVLYGLGPAVMAYRLRAQMNHEEMLPGGTRALVVLAALTAGYTVWQTALLTG